MQICVAKVVLLPRVGIRELKAKEIEELKALANEIYTPVLWPD